MPVAMDVYLARCAAAHRREAATHRRAAALALESAARYDSRGHLKDGDRRRAQAERQLRYAQAADAAAAALER